MSSTYKSLLIGLAIGLALVQVVGSRRYEIRGQNGCPADPCIGTYKPVCLSLFGQHMTFPNPCSLNVIRCAVGDKVKFVHNGACANDPENPNEERGRRRYHYGGYSAGRPIYRPSRPIYHPGRPIYSPGRPIYSPGMPIYDKHIYGGGRPIYGGGRPIYSPGMPIYDKHIYGGGRPIYPNGRPINGGPYHERSEAYYID